MPLERFTIAPINSGLETNKEPFLIPEDAFDVLENAYVFRGRVRSRYGTRPVSITGNDQQQNLKSRLRIKIGETDNDGNIEDASVPLPIAAGQIFSVGDFTITVTSSNGDNFSYGFDINADIDVSDPSSPTFSISGSPLSIQNEDVFFYPALPCMKFLNIAQDDVSDEILYAFDTRFMYRFQNDAFERVGTASWSGENDDFHSVETFIPTLESQRQVWIVNDNPDDLIKIYNPVSGNFVSRNYQLQPNEYIFSARIVVSYQQRILFISPWIGPDENDPSTAVRYRNRIVYSDAGVDPLTNNAFRTDISGSKASSIFASTSEQAIGVSFVRDRLIVFFEKSTYQLAPTGRNPLPFRFQKINTELGCESSNSVVVVDGVAVGVGNVGIHQTNGNEVKRIDEKIPDQVFKINNANDGVERVCGIKDYFKEIIYWNYPEAGESRIFPNKVLMFNYQNGSWAIIDDSITAFGYSQRRQSLTWSEISWTWSAWSSPWDSSTYQSLSQDVVAGNQQGLVSVINTEIQGNAKSLYITNLVQPDQSINELVLTVINHNLDPGDYIQIHDLEGDTDPSFIDSLNGNIVQVSRVVDFNTFVINGTIYDEEGLIDNYQGNGKIELVPIIDIKTKNYNFYLDDGYKSEIPKISFYVQKTNFGEVTVNVFTNTSSRSLNEDGEETGALMGNSVLETFPYESITYEQSQSKLWHTVYTQADGETINLRITLSPEQSTNADIVKAQFILYAMTFYVSRGGEIT